MKRALLIGLGVLVPGGLAVLAWVAWSWWRDSKAVESAPEVISGSEGAAPDAPPEVVAAEEANVSTRTVEGIVLLGAIDVRLLTDLSAYQLDPAAPEDLVFLDVKPPAGLRIGDAAAFAQADAFRLGGTNARTLDQTPHGRGGAFDFNIRDRNSGRVLWPDLAANIARFASVGAWFKARGRTWGGDFQVHGSTGKSTPDYRHVEVSDWQRLPYPPVLASSAGVA